MVLSGCGSGGGQEPATANAKQQTRFTKAGASAADYEVAVQALYVSYFGRPADPAGLTNFENALLAAGAPADIGGLANAYKTNASVRTLIDAFGVSAESNALYGSGSTSAFVNAIFRNVLNRTPQPSGQSFWVQAIDSGALTAGNAALSIMAGAFANNSTQGQIDQQLINNRLTVAAYFSAQVVNQGAVAEYAGSIAAGNARTMLAAVVATTDTTGYESTVIMYVDNMGGTAKTVGFSPASLSFNFASGSTTPVVLTATAQGTNEFPGSPGIVYVSLSDANGIFTVNPRAVETSSNSYAITLYPSASAAAGAHQGNLKLSLCADSACASPFTGSPWTIPYNVQVAASPLGASPNQSTAASMNAGGAEPANIGFTVQGQGLDWTVGTNVAWMQPSVSTGSGNGGFMITFAASALSAGSYSGNVTVRSSDGQAVVVPITLQVLASSFQITGGTAAFTAVNGAPIPTQPIDFSASNNAVDSWTATGDSSWLLVTPASGTTPAVLNIGIDPTKGPLAAGTYSGNAIVSSPQVSNLDIPVTLNLVKATLSATPSSVTMGGTLGRSFSSLPLAISLNTGSNSWPWTLSNVPSGISVSSTSGTVGGSGVNLTVSGQPAAAGGSTAVMTLKAQVNGDSLSIPISVAANADQHKLTVSESGVGFSSTPNWSRLTHNITLSDNFGMTTAWTAQSNQPWLTVTASGTTGASGSTVTLTADPSTLTQNAVSYATVTFTPATANMQAVTVKVGVWVGSGAPAATTGIATAYTKIVADTIRPYVYVNNGTTSIDAYNLYTGQKIATFSGVGNALGEMSVSGNGDRLYVLDTVAKNVVVVDLVNQAVLETWPLYAAISGDGMHIISAHPNGVEVVLVGDGTAYTADGVFLGGTLFYGNLAASSDGKVLMSEGLFGSLDYSAVSGGQLFINGTAISTANVRTFDMVGMTVDPIALSPDGSRAYLADVPSGYACRQYSTANNQLSLIGYLPNPEAYPNTVKVDINGRIYCGMMEGMTYDVQLYSPTGAFLHGYKWSNLQGYNLGLAPQGIAISPDGFVMAGISGDPMLEIIAVGP
ncbi:MAG TPA: DUF4214 domain-containing protein [Burkholderiaceae bacterium]